MRKCPGCGMAVSDQLEKCLICGAEILDIDPRKIRAQKIKRLRKSIRRFRPLLWIIAVFVFGLIFLMVKIPYYIINEYREAEPYVADLCTDVNTSFTARMMESEGICIDGKCIEWKVLHPIETPGRYQRYEMECINYTCFNYVVTCSLLITNEEKEGEFSMLGFALVDNTTTQPTEIITYINSSEAQLIVWNESVKEEEFVGCSFELIRVPMKSVCEQTERFMNITKRNMTVQKTGIPGYILMWLFGAPEA